ncbi:MAG: hypothetical protein LBD50_03540 [Rickettsiales bacterium]|jgi:opacity protein-like surface antigen|nr:hypothetical protein [Rickettsiales bacterium]
MKKLASVFILAGFAASAAAAAPSYIKRDAGSGYKVTYDYKDKEKGGWYAALRAQLNLLSWENTYFSDYVGYSGGDKYSMKPVFGGSLSFGKRFDYFWRVELEAGYTGMFTDEGQGMEFNFSIPYLLANAMYDFSNGLYLGGGLGAAFPMTTWKGDLFLPGGRTKVAVSPMAGLMAGYVHKLDDNMVLDLRYRIAGFNGSKHTRNFEDLSSIQYYFESKIGLVLENSFSVALRYEF